MADRTKLWIAEKMKKIMATKPLDKMFLSMPENMKRIYELSPVRP